MFYLTQAEGLVTGTMVKMFTIALSGDRLRHRGECAVRAGAGAAGGDGVICSLWEAASNAVSHKNVRENVPGNCE